MYLFKILPIKTYLHSWEFLFILWLFIYLFIFFNIDVNLRYETSSKKIDRNIFHYRDILVHKHTVFFQYKILNSWTNDSQLQVYR